MIDWLGLAEELISSPWLFLILIAVSLLDSFLPAIPSEPVIVVAGVYAASGETYLLPVIAATAVGAFLGDMVPYGLGRLMAEPALRRLPVGTKRRRVHDWLSGELESRAAYVLITSRFDPVGRYLVTLTAGMTRLSWPKFAGYTAISVVAWSTYTVLAGYLGGTLFGGNPLLGIGVGLALAILISALMEIARRVRLRRTSAAPELAGKVHDGGL
jgi:membrane protein DedA with SNARE-associated domain